MTHVTTFDHVGITVGMIVTDLDTVCGAQRLGQAG